MENNGNIFGIPLFLLSLTILSYEHYRATEMVITNKRIILKKGIIINEVKEIEINQCQKINIKKGFFGTIFNYGTIKFSEFDSKMKWKGISNPKKIKNEIEYIIETNIKA
ncbi:MAG: PH domain-containing protein [Alphaproteobacteria bacterium]|nr:PH domain-containing protein [Alphaproteobacteria bacterium]